MKTRNTTAKRTGAKRTPPTDKASAQVAQLLAQCQANIDANPYIGQKYFNPVDRARVKELFEKELPAKLQAFDFVYLTGMSSTFDVQSLARTASRIDPQHPIFEIYRDHSRYSELLATLEQAACFVRETVLRLEAAQAEQHKGETTGKTT